MGSNVETITVNVVDKFDPNTNESINAHDFDIQLEDVNDKILLSMQSQSIHRIGWKT
ncbi:hypothetical protein [Erysipelothrix piscisicarius]|uniref:hypothetical protein n=1 Tax=Erysipelothrix piscisicarius TaxID=2485784 RepID=UPI001E508402|nr:hypothetical protein [Erysipelothrix piscisicarius]